MNLNTQTVSPSHSNENEPEFEGLYGTYRITYQDQIEVKRYRQALLVCAISLFFGLIQWISIGASWASIWLVPLTLGLGLSLKWIHIYLQPLHKLLQVLWLLGTLGILFLSIKIGVNHLLPSLASKPILTLIIGPFFAALTGVGFKEFFCFRRAEAIGVTILIPIALIGHLTQILNQYSVIIILLFSSILLLILSIRKFGMDASLDVGDKSIFDYLETGKSATAL